MLRRGWVSATVAATVLVTGCGDDGGSESSELDEYYLMLDDELAQLRSDSGDAFETWRATDGTSLEERQGAVADLLRFLDRFLESMEAVEPPAVVSDLHADALADSRTYRAALAEVVAEAQQATTVEELREVMVDEELQQRFQQFNANCHPFQQRADEHGVLIDLDCPA